MLSVDLCICLLCKAAIRPGKLYPDKYPWAVRAIRITVHGYPDNIRPGRPAAFERHRR
jgi:hypothetical protein